MHLDFSWIKSTSRTLLIDLEAPSSERLDLPSRCQGGWAGPLFFASFSWWLVCTRLNHFRPKSIAEKMHLVLAYHSWLDQPRRSLQDCQIPSHHLHQHPAPLVMTTADIFTRSATTSIAAAATAANCNCCFPFSVDFGAFFQPWRAFHPIALYCYYCCYC